MNRIMILDCTLRDGGYVNNWNFGIQNIHSVISELVHSNVEIIECGYVSKKKPCDPNSTQFNSVEMLNALLPADRKNCLMVAMINFGEYLAEDIPERIHTGIDGFRVAFHKDNAAEALEFCMQIKDKGYAVFVQPMVTLNYTDREFLSLISVVNQVKPYAFYVVDSFGAMESKDLLHLFYLTDSNLDKDVCIGFHSHNNLQQSSSLAQLLVGQNTDRKTIIDSSVFGMGRGAGNLNSELFAEHLNKFYGKNYKIRPMLKIMDDVLAPIYQNKYWGYSLPHYLSAVYNCHPNYATFLDDKNTLTYEDIESIFQSIPAERRSKYSADYIRDLYSAYQNSKTIDSGEEELLKMLAGKDIVILAPGKSLEDERERVANVLAETDALVIAVNFIPENYETDFCFFGNIRRWEARDSSAPVKTIITSNIKSERAATYIIPYSDLVNETEHVTDNSGLMLIALLIKAGVKSILLAGMDGYRIQSLDNFVERTLEFSKSATVMQAMNDGITKVLTTYSKQVPIKFITKERFVHIAHD